MAYHAYLEATNLRKSNATVVTFYLKKILTSHHYITNNKKLGITRLCFELFIA